MCYNYIIKKYKIRTKEKYEQRSRIYRVCSKIDS
jgi:hypothetical protein